MAASIPDVENLSVDELKKLVFWLLERDAVREAEMAALREEIARLKGLKGRPKIRPSGMEPATDARAKEGSAKTRRLRGAKRVAITEERVITMAAPPGSRFKGYESYVVEDLVVRPATRGQRRHRDGGRRIPDRDRQGLETARRPAATGPDAHGHECP